MNRASGGAASATSNRRQPLPRPLAQVIVPPRDLPPGRIPDRRADVCPNPRPLRRHDDRCRRDDRRRYLRAYRDRCGGVGPGFDPRVRPQRCGDAAHGVRVRGARVGDPRSGWRLRVRASGFPGRRRIHRRMDALVRVYRRMQSVRSGLRWILLGVLPQVHAGIGRPGVRAGRGTRCRSRRDLRDRSPVRPAQCTRGRGDGDGRERAHGLPSSSSWGSSSRTGSGHSAGPRPARSPKRSIRFSRAA